MIRKTFSSKVAERLYEKCIQDLDIDCSDVEVDKTTGKTFNIYHDELYKKYTVLITGGAEISRAILKKAGYCLTRIKNEYKLGAICGVEQDPGIRETTVIIIPVYDWNQLATAGQAKLTEQVSFLNYSKEVHQTVLGCFR